MFKNFEEVNIELNGFNYYCGVGSDGTLLHGAACQSFVGYVELLLKNGFDPNMKSRHEDELTPVLTAKQEKQRAILSLLEESEEKQQEDMDMQSLSLRYDVT